MDTQHPSVGVVTKVVGQVNVKSDGNTHSLKAGEIIHQNDKISTEDKSSVSLLMTDGKIIDIASNDSQKLGDVTQKVPADVIQNAVMQNVSPEQISHAIETNQPIAELLPMHVDHLYYVPWVTLGKVESGFPTNHSVELPKTPEDYLMFRREKPDEINRADLSVDKSVSDNTPDIGDKITYCIEVHNTGPNAAINTIVTDVIPNGLKVFNISNGGVYNSQTHTITWNLGNLPAGFSDTLTYRAIVTSHVALENVINNVNIISNTFDPNLPNNHSDTPIDPQDADLKIDKSLKHGSDPTPDNNEYITFKLVVTNLGNDEAQNAYAIDHLPQGLDYISSYGDGSYNKYTGKWTIGDLAAGETATLYIKVKVDLTEHYVNLEEIKNTAIVKSETFDPNLKNNKDSVTIDPKDADLKIEKSLKYSSDYTPNNGDEVIFKLVVTNLGHETAENVYTIDNIPNGMDFVNSSGTGSYDNATGKWTIGDLDAGNTATIYITMKVDLTEPYVNLDTITNTATVYSSTYDKDLTNNTDSQDVRPQDIDLSLTKTVNDATPNVGSNITYTITLNNAAGHDTATDISVKDVLPDGLSLVSVTPTSGTYNNGVWSINSLASGSSVTLTFVATVTSNVNLTSFTNTAEVIAAGQYDVDSIPNDHQGDDYAAAIVSPKEIDLSLSKTVSNSTPNIGENITYTVTLTNAPGHETATDISVKDVLPDGLSLVSVTPTSGTYNNGVWSINSLASGSSVTLTFVATVTSNVNLTSFTNTAEVIAAGQYDVDSIPNDHQGDDYAAAIVSPKEIDLSLTKTISNNTPHVGDNITYVVTLSNAAGHETATSITVKDVLPDGLSLVSVTPTSGTYNNGEWSVNSLASGSSVTLTFVAKVTANASFTNVAEVIAAGQYDVDSIPNDHQGDDYATVNATSVNPLPSAVEASNTVAESALSTGTIPPSGAEIAMGSIGYSFGTDLAAGSTPFTFGSGVVAQDGETLSSINLFSNGVPVNTWSITNSGLTITGKAGGVDVIKVEITNVANGTYTVTLLDQLDHPDVGQTGSNDPILLKIPYTIKDGSGDTASSVLNVTVLDDGPTANQVTKSVTEGNIKTNLMLTIDVSGSMDDPSGLTGLKRMDVQKAAAIELIDQYYNLGNNTDANIAIRIITFSTNADPHGSTWESVASAKAFINSLNPGGSTNYDEALTDSISAFANNTKVSGAQNVAYFFSDGEPTAPDNSIGINPAEQGAWETFLKANNINAFALGLGPNASLDALLPIAYNGVTGTDSNGTNAMIITNLADLSAALTGTISTVSGNVIGEMGVNYGADQPGKINSITYGDKIYTYNSNSDSIITSASGGSGSSAQSFDAANNIITITTSNQGTLKFDFDDGSYNYNAPANLNSNISATFKVMFSDFDNDIFTQNLIINVMNGDLPPIVRDDSVFTNITGNGATIAIPDFALLYNDTDADGNIITVSAVSNASDGTVSHDVPTLTVIFKDENNRDDGGSFDYTGTANGKNDTAHVTVDREQSGENTLDGNGFGNILIARNNATTLNGNEGNDVLIGGSAADILNGGTGSDLLKGGLGNDSFTGGAGADRFLFAKADINTPAQTDTITDFVKTEGDILDLSDLLTGGTPALGSSPSALQLTNYLNFSQSGANTVLTIDANGSTGGASVSHTVTFQNTNLFTQFGAANSQDLIANMQTANQIVAHG
jgi:uncharacterized repeat protein (TIGR01451 family)